MAWIFLLKLLLLGACLLTRATSASPFSSATSNAVLYGNSNGVFGEAEFFNATSLRFVICHSNTTVPPINLTTIANTLEFVALFNSSSFGNGTVAARQAVNVTDLPDFALYTDGCAYGSWSSNASFNSVTRLNLTTQLWVRNRYTGLVLSQLHVGARDRVRNASVANKPPDTDRYPRNYSINDDYEKPKQLRITFNLSFVDAQSHFCQDVADLISNTSVPPVPRSRIVCSSSVDAGAVVVVVNITQVCTRDSLCTTETSARHEQAEDIVARVKSQINDTHSALNRSFAHGVLAVCNDSGFQECEKHRDVPQLAFPPRPQHIQILVSSVNGSLTFTPPVVSLYSYDVTTWVWMDPMNPHTMTFVDDFGDPNNYLCNIPDASSQLSSGYDCATNPSSYARKAPYNYTTTWTPLWWLPDPFNYTYVDSLNPGNMTGLIRYLGLNPNYPKGVPTVEVSVGNEQNAIAYFPAHVSVYIGQSVKWKWASTTVRHTVTGGAPPNNTLDWCSLTDGVDETTDSCFASEDSFVAEHEYTHEFAAVGEYPYFCGVHDGAMVGSVSVLDRNANPLPTTAPPTSIPLDQETHLIVGMGQSNMQGTGVYDPLIDNITDSNILQYGSCGNDTGKLVLAVEPLQHLGTPCPVPLPGTPERTIGLLLPLARAYAADHPGVRIVIVPCGFGDTSFSRGRWEVGGDLYALCIQHYNVAWSLVGNNARPALMAWHQGEADTGDTGNGYFIGQTGYSETIERSIAGWRSEMSGASTETPFVLGTLALPYGQGNAFHQAIMAAHASIPTFVYTSRLAPSDGLDAAGGFHFVSSGYRAYGPRYNQQLRNITATVDKIPPTLDSVTGFAVEQEHAFGFVHLTWNRVVYAHGYNITWGVPLRYRVVKFLRHVILTGFVTGQTVNISIRAFYTSSVTNVTVYSTSTSSVNTTGVTTASVPVPSWRLQFNSSASPILAGSDVGAVVVADPGVYQNHADMSFPNDTQRGHFVLQRVTPNGQYGSGLIVTGTTPMPASYSKTAWVKAFSTVGEQSYISSLPAETAASGHTMLLRPGGILQGGPVTDRDGDDYRSVGSFVDLNKWTFVAMTFNDTSKLMTVYKDGEEYGFKYVAHPVTAFGNSSTIAFYSQFIGLNGCIDYPSRYDTTLTAAQVYATYIAQS